MSSRKFFPRRRNRDHNLVTHLVSALFGASIGFFVHSQLSSITPPSNSRGDDEDVTITDDKSVKVDKFPPSAADTISILSPTSPIISYRPNEHLEIAYDTRTKNPVYVLERLLPRSERTSTEHSVSRDGLNFYEEKSLPSIHRSRNGYYRNSGYDRGHHAPAADFTMTDKHMKDTFTLCNISPQTPKLNRKIWSRLETLVRQLVDEEEKAAVQQANENLSSYVITGPLWLPSLKVNDEKVGYMFQYSFPGLGYPPSLLQVPTHFFKVVATIACSKQNNKPMHVRKIAAFVFPNSNFDRLDSINIQDYTVRISDLEAVSGMLFFPNIWKRRYTEEYSDDVCLEKKLIDLTTDKLRIDHKSQKPSTEGITKPTTEMNSLLILPQSSQDGVKISKELKEVSRQINKSGNPLPDHFCMKNACNVVIRL